MTQKVRPSGTRKCCDGIRSRCHGVSCAGPNLQHGFFFGELNTMSDCNKHDDSYHGGRLKQKAEQYLQ